MNASSNYRDNLYRWETEDATMRFGNALNAAGLAPQDNPPRHKSFAEQLALVAAGRARVIPVIPIRKETNRTLGGVSGEFDI